MSYVNWSGNSLMCTCHLLLYFFLMDLCIAIDLRTPSLLESIAPPPGKESPYQFRAAQMKETSDPLAATLHSMKGFNLIKDLWAPKVSYYDAKDNVNLDL